MDAKVSSSDGAPATTRPRFTLRHLFLLITALAVLLSIYFYVGVLVIAAAYALVTVGLLVYGFVRRNVQVLFCGSALLLLGTLSCFSGGLDPLLTRPGPGRAGQCDNNMGLLMKALHLYHGDRGAFPLRNFPLADGTPGWSWRAILLPYLDERHRAEQIHWDEPWNSQHNLAFSTPTPYILCCPSSANSNTLGETQYFAVAGPDTCWPDGQRLKLSEIPDGASNTAMLVESHDASVLWSEPRDLDASTMRYGPINSNLGPPPDVGPSSPHHKQRDVVYFSDLTPGHPAGAHIAMADGSTRFIRQDIDPEVVKQLIHRQDGKPRSARP